MKAKYGILILLAMWGTVSCSDILDIPYSNPRNAGGTADGTLGRKGTEDSRRTLLVYSAAFHNDRYKCILIYISGNFYETYGRFSYAHKIFGWKKYPA